mmetsp:Transcript_22780/g.58380  ORF Transcript_22780/g.58380 Transcript_22780/m.58380 type:complete len:274 (+) Transcript_22780:64-885(+)
MRVARGCMWLRGTRGKRPPGASAASLGGLRVPLLPQHLRQLLPDNLPQDDIAASDGGGIPAGAYQALLETVHVVLQILLHRHEVVGHGVDLLPRRLVHVLQQQVGLLFELARQVVRHRARHAGPLGVAARHSFIVRGRQLSLGDQHLEVPRQVASAPHALHPQAELHPDEQLRAVRRQLLLRRLQHLLKALPHHRDDQVQQQDGLHVHKGQKHDLVEDVVLRRLENLQVDVAQQHGVHAQHRVPEVLPQRGARNLGLHAGPPHTEEAEGAAQA